MTTCSLNRPVVPKENRYRCTEGLPVGTSTVERSLHAEFSHGGVTRRISDALVKPGSYRFASGTLLTKFAQMKRHLYDYAR